MTIEIPRPVETFLDACLIPWAYEIIPKDAPVPESLGAFQIIYEIIGQISDEIFPPEWLEEVTREIDEDDEGVPMYV